MKETYHCIMNRVGEAATRSNRKPLDIVTVVVTKTATPDQIRTVVELGHIDLGESRLQQLIQRAAQLDEFLSRKRTLGRASSMPSDEAPGMVRWHMIGHLQRNKVKQVVPLVRLIHAVDSLRLAEEIQAVASQTDSTIDILLQINASGDPARQGIAPPAVLHLAEQIDSMVHVRLRGIMSMAAMVEDPEDTRPTFARTAEIFGDVRSEGIGGDQFNILSMGMSNDFEVAIEEGANVLRIGRALFGEG